MNGYCRRTWRADPLAFLFSPVVITMAILLSCSRGDAQSGAVKGPVPPPGSPICKRIVGAASVAFSRDGGNTLVGDPSGLEPFTYTSGIAVLTAVPAMVLIEQGKILVSKDAGCTWEALSVAEEIPVPFPGMRPLAIRNIQIIAGGPTTALAKAGSDLLVFIDSTHLKAIMKAPAPIGSVVSDRDDNHLRLIGDDAGDLWESADGAITWKRVGQPPVHGPFVFTTGQFAPKADHVIICLLNAGVWVSFNNGVTWESSRGIPPDSAFDRVVFSPADDRIVWLIGRYGNFYRSDDGGRSFTEFTALAGPISAAAADPRDGSVLYFADTFGTVYRYTTGRWRRLSKQKVPAADSLVYVSGMAFSAVDPSVMYLTFSRAGAVE